MCSRNPGPIRCGRMPWNIWEIRQHVRRFRIKWRKRMRLRWTGIRRRIGRRSPFSMMRCFIPARGKKVQNAGYYDGEIIIYAKYLKIPEGKREEISPEIWNHRKNRKKFQKVVDNYSLVWYHIKASRQKKLWCEAFGPWQINSNAALKIFRSCEDSNRKRSERAQSGRGPEAW